MLFGRHYTYKRGVVIAAAVLLFVGAAGSLSLLAGLVAVPALTEHLVRRQLRSIEHEYQLEIGLGNAQHIGKLHLLLSDLLVRDRRFGHYLEIDSLTLAFGVGAWLKPQASLKAVTVQSALLHLHEQADGIKISGRSSTGSLHTAGMAAQAGGAQQLQVRSPQETGLLETLLGMLSGGKALPRLQLDRIHISFSSDRTDPGIPLSGIVGEGLSLTPEGVSGRVWFQPELRFPFSLLGVPLGADDILISLTELRMEDSGVVQVHDLQLSTGTDPDSVFLRMPELQIQHHPYSFSTTVGTELWQRISELRFVRPELELYIDPDGRYGTAPVKSPRREGGHEAGPVAETETTVVARLHSALVRLPRVSIQDAHITVHDLRSRLRPRLSPTLQLDKVEFSLQHTDDTTSIFSSGRVIDKHTQMGDWRLAFARTGHTPTALELELNLPSIGAVAQLAGGDTADRVRGGSLQMSLLPAAGPVSLAPAGAPQDAEELSRFLGHFALHSAELRLPFLAEEQFSIADITYDYILNYQAVSTPGPAQLLRSYHDTPDTSSARGELGVEAGILSIGNVSLELQPALRGLFGNHGRPVRAETQLYLPATPIQELVELMPAPVLGAFVGMQLEGTLDWEFEIEVPLYRPSRMEWRSVVRAPEFGVSYLPPEVDVFKLAGSFEHTIVDPTIGYERRVHIPAMQAVSNQWMRENSGMTPAEVAADPRRKAWFRRLPETAPRRTPVRAATGGYRYLRLEEIAPWVPRAVLSGEDSWFFAHRGFDWPAVKRAFELNLQEGRYVVGASTISMQLMKNLFLNHDRVAARKLQEAFLVFLVEEYMELPKERILELYLNIVEFGPAVFGIHQAADHYFAKTPGRLDVTEAVWLASILPSPKTYHRQFEYGQVFEWWLQRKEQYMAGMVRRDRLTQDQYESLLGVKPVFRNGDT